ncbi:MAG: GDSL-type esterase/lipase family protein [Acidimicrobiales bacterium]
MATLAIPSLAAGTYNLWAAPWDTRQLGTQIGPNTFTVGSSPTTTTAPPSTTTTVAPTTTTTVPAPTTTTTVPPTTTTTTTVPPLDPPTQVHATKGYESATITWTPPSGQFTRYKIEFSGECPSCGGTEPPVGARETTVTGLTNGSSYAFIVAAFHDGRSQVARSEVSNPVIPGPPKYAALGDSYSSGEGAHGDDPPCNQSSEAYGPVYANELAPDPKPAFVFLACTGEQIDGLVEDQIPFTPYDADLVTLTIGGNDVGFRDVIIYCLAAPNCEEHYPDKQQEIRDLLPRLIDTYNRVLDQAAAARVVVLTYPTIFSDTDDFECGVYISLDGGERRWLRARNADLRDVIVDAVNSVRNQRQDGQRLEVLDELSAFEGHDIAPVILPPTRPW